MSEFTRQLTGRYTVTRSPESRAPIACEPLPPQPRAFEQEVLDALAEDLEALPSWDRRDVGRWRQERAALEAASAALEPAPITARGVVRGLLRAAIAIPLIVITEARRG